MAGASVFMDKSIAPSTARKYSGHFKRYIEFCRARNLQAFPVQQQNLILWCTFLAKDIAYCSIKAHLVAIKFYAEVHRYQTEISSFHRLYLTLRGIRRVHKNKHAKQKRLPITPDLLRKIYFNLQNSSTRYKDKLMLKAAMLTEFFAFLRISQYTK